MRLCRAMYVYVGPYRAVSKPYRGLRMAMYRYVRLCMSINGCVGLCMALLGYVWICRSMHGYVIIIIIIIIL